MKAKTEMPPHTHALIFKCRYCGEFFDRAVPDLMAATIVEEFPRLTPYQDPRDRELVGRCKHEHADGSIGFGDLAGVRPLSENERARVAMKRKAEERRKRHDARAAAIAAAAEAMPKPTAPKRRDPTPKAR